MQSSRKGMKRMFYAELVLASFIFVVFLNKYYIYSHFDLSNTLLIFTITEYLFVGLCLLSIIHLITCRVNFTIFDAVHQLLLVVFIFLGIQFLDPSFNFYSLREHSKILQLLLPYYGFWFILRLFYVYMRAYFGVSLFNSKYNMVSGFVSGFCFIIVTSLILGFYLFTYLPFSLVTLLILIMLPVMLNYVFFAFMQKRYAYEFRLGMKRGVIMTDLLLIGGLTIMLPSIFFTLGA